MNVDQTVLKATELPPDFAAVLRGMTDDGMPPETLADAIEALDRLWDAAGITIYVNQMYQEEPTRHVVDFGEREEYVPCVLDALIAAFAVGDTPAEIRSTEPTRDETVYLSVTDDGVDVDPATAVFTFGVADGEIQNPDLSALEGTDSVVMASCSYINAFRETSAYEQWKGTLSDAYVMQIDAETLTAFAEVAADEWVVAGSA